MKAKLFLILITFLLINFIAAQSFCVDFDEPSAPPNLAVSSSGTNIILSWNSATDIPDCSGIDYYNVSRDGIWIGTTSFDTLTYTDKNVPYGTYSYTVYAVDKVGHNSGPAIKNDVILSAPSSGGGGTTVSGGSGGSSHICYEEWQCGNWGECINERQTRTCEDLEQCSTIINKPAEFRACSVEEKEGQNLTTPAQTSSFINLLTGAVTGVTQFVKSGTGTIMLFILIIVGLATLTILLRKRIEKVPKETENF